MVASPVSSKTLHTAPSASTSKVSAPLFCCRADPVTVCARGVVYGYVGKSKLLHFLGEYKYVSASGAFVTYHGAKKAEEHIDEYERGNAWLTGHDFEIHGRDRRYWEPRMAAPHIDVRCIMLQILTSLAFLQVCDARCRGGHAVAVAVLRGRCRCCR